MSKLPLVARILLGLVFTVFGSNGFLHFIPMPPMEGPSGALINAMVSSGYLIYLIDAAELVAGLLLLAGYVPLGLVILAPVLVNIVFFHLVLAPQGIGLGLFALLLELYLAWAYRAAFQPLVRTHGNPPTP